MWSLETLHIKYDCLVLTFFAFLFFCAGDGCLLFSGTVDKENHHAPQFSAMYHMNSNVENILCSGSKVVYHTGMNFLITPKY